MKLKIKNISILIYGNTWIRESMYYKIMVVFVVQCISGMDLKAQQGVSTTNNYIQTYNPMVTGVNESNITGRTIDDVNQSIDFIDGLGRPIQRIQIQGSPAKKDVVQPIIYDALGRQAFNYLPYAAATSNGSFKTAAAAEATAFYTTPPSGVTAITSPFSETAFERSPLSRTIEQGALGTEWQLAAGHTKKILYTANNAGEMRNWKITASGVDASTRYNEREIRTTIYYDENQIPIREYLDKDGRLIAKRLESAPETFETTFYVYDDLGNLRYVVPPGFTSLSFTEASTGFGQYIYAYHYDEFNRVIERKIPGKGWEYIVYNKLDQVVATQDAVQRGSNEWNFTKYDGLGRVIITGYWNNNNTAITPAALKTMVDGLALWESSTGTGSIGYTNLAFPTTNLTTSYTYTINYYDDYSFPGAPVAFTAPAGSSTRTEGLLTGTKTQVLSTSTMLFQVNYYDDQARVIKTYKQHYKGLTVTGNYDEITNTYKNAVNGQVTNTTRKHYLNSVLSVTIANDYTYDHVGRRLRNTSKFNTDPAIILSSLRYNETGQLFGKKLHSEDGGGVFLQSINYYYNERSWIKSIKSELFAEGLKYNFGPNAPYNGNIAKVLYGAGDITDKDYTFTYDSLYRLKSGISSLGNHEQGITYDDMGNITKLTRYSAGTNLGTNTYTYTGNRLTSLSGFINANYTYDANSRIGSDGRTGYAIAYNRIDLAKAMIKGLDTIRYLHDGTGNKLRMTRNTPQPKLVEYIDGILYVGGSIESIQTEEGRALRSGNSYSYQYALKDHLGNSRVFFKKNGSTTQTIQNIDYYPFGLPIETQWDSPKNLYLYNGKEYQYEDSKYFDYGARLYDPVIGRWNSLDPLAEKMSSWSPYNYGFNNPISFTDPDGRSPEADYFDSFGFYMGSDNVNDKEIRIIDVTKQLVNSVYNGTYNSLPFNFRNADGTINREVGMAISQNISSYSPDKRLKMSGNILNHYYKEAGYDLNKLASGKIDNTPGGWQQSIGATKLGGYSRFSQHLKPGEFAVEVDYGYLGEKIRSGFDAINLFRHERGSHYVDLLNHRDNGAIVNDDQSERDAFFFQMQDPTWKFTSPQFRNHMYGIDGKYLQPGMKEKYFNK